MALQIDGEAIHSRLEKDEGSEGDTSKNDPPHPRVDGDAKDGSL